MPLDIRDFAFKTFVESAPVLCLAADTDYITTYVNPFYKQIHNISQDEAVGKHIKDIIGDEGFYDNLPHYEKTLQGNIVEYRGSFNKLDGSIHHYKATYAPIYDASEQVVGITGVVLDITSEVEIEFTNQKLKKLNSEFQKAQQELTRLASTDPLTDLYNRRYFSEISESMFKLAARQESDLSVVLLDADNFKRINDTYGHKVGDNVLIKLAEQIRANVRKSDVVCRYGGEEFIVLLPETDLEGAVVVAENIRQHIEQAHVTVNQALDIEFRASLGVACAEFPQEDHIEQVIYRADNALYRAKEQGKNQVVADLVGEMQVLQ